MSSDPVSAAVSLRSIRPPEAPFAGELITGPLGPRYRVPVTDATQRVWSAAPGGHLLAPLDVDRVDGADVLELPRLVGRIDDVEFVSGLVAGQAVTLVVSVLRGAAEAAEAAWDDGEWWLTADGRPVLVPVGGRPWPEASHRVVSLVPETAIDADMRRRVLAVLGEPDTTAATAPEVEELLFEVAEPRPLKPSSSGSGGPFGRAHGRGDAEPPVHTGIDTTDAARGTGTAGRSEAVVSAVRSAVRGLVDDRVAARVADAWHEVGPRLRRRAPLVAVAVLVAGAASAAGLLWTSPGADADDTAGAPSAAEERALSDATPDPAVVEPAAPRVDAAAGGSDDGGAVVFADRPSTDPDADAGAGESDPDAAGAAAVIDALSVCWRTGDPTCRADVLERPDAAIPDGVVLADTDRSVVLLDDLGGVEVVRVEDAEARTRPQIAVIVVHDDRRLVRDVYDVADQP